MKNNLDNLDDSNDWHLWTQLPYVPYKITNHDKNKTIQLPKISSNKEEEKKREVGQKEDYGLPFSYDESLYAKGKEDHKEEEIQ